MERGYVRSVLSIILSIKRYVPSARHRNQCQGRSSTCHPTQRLQTRSAEGAADGEDDRTRDSRWPRQNRVQPNLIQAVAVPQVDMEIAVDLEDVEETEVEDEVTSRGEVAVIEAEVEISVDVTGVEDVVVGRMAT